MNRTVNLYEAKTNLSSLVDEAAEGAEIVIAKNGVPKAQLVPLPVRNKRRKPAGALKGLTISEDFDAPLPDLEKLFDGD